MISTDRAEIAQHFFTPKVDMADYSAAILALIAVTAVLTTGVVYVLAQPTDVPVAKREG